MAMGAAGGGVSVVKVCTSASSSAATAAMQNSHELRAHKRDP